MTGDVVSQAVLDRLSRLLQWAFGLVAAAVFVAFGALFYLGSWKSAHEGRILANEEKVEQVRERLNRLEQRQYEDRRGLRYPGPMMREAE